MIRPLAVLCACALLLGACSSSKKQADSPSTSVVTVAPATSAPAGSSTTASTASTIATTTTTFAELPTTSLPCPAMPPTKTPVTSPGRAPTVYLTGVVKQAGGCAGNVSFVFKGATQASPGYSVTYGTPPFVTDGSGAPIAVAGNAFIVVTIKSGYTGDIVTGQPTYTGPKRIPGAPITHVKEIVLTGDFEGVLTWVIGLDAKRPFTVQSVGTPRHYVQISIF